MPHKPLLHVGFRVSALVGARFLKRTVASNQSPKNPSPYRGADLTCSNNARKRNVSQGKPPKRDRAYKSVNSCTSEANPPCKPSEEANSNGVSVSFLGNPTLLEQSQQLRIKER